MDGDTVTDIYSDAFIEMRSRALGVSAEEYKQKMHVPHTLGSGKYSKICLHFGGDTFCQANLLTLLAYLEQIKYQGKVSLNYIDDESFEVLDGNISVTLGIYKRLYEEIFIENKLPKELGVLNSRAFDLYFDYHSDCGALSRLVRDNREMDETSLLCLLLEKTKEYGLSDLQATKLIEKYRKKGL